MEFDTLINELVGKLDKSNDRHKNASLSQKFMDILLRIKRGWLICLLIFVFSVIIARLIYIPLSKIHSTTTKMGVMFNKEKEANKQGNIVNEVVGRITGWTTTTNKYDEVSILTSHTVVGRMLLQNGKLESAYRKHKKEIGHLPSYDDSVKFINAYIEAFLKRVEAKSNQTSIKSNISTSLIVLSLKGRVEDSGPLLIGLVNSYNQYTREYNNKLYDSTLRFLNHCADSLKNELDKLDDYERQFRENNLIVNLPQQSNEYLKADREIEDDLRNINLQIQLLSIIRNYMVEMGKQYKVVPANTGIDDEQINRIVIQFNDLVMRRSNFLTSMGEDAMRVQTITNQIEDQRQALIISIDKLTQSFNIRKSKFEQDLKDSNTRLEKMPHKQITMEQIERERKIKAPLYQLMQEKYTETLIAKSAEQDQARIVTYPYMEETKLFDSPQKLYIIAILVGILLSALYLWNLKLPPRQMTLEETLRECELPCWSVLPKAMKSFYFRTALQALLSRVRMSGAKIIAITCSYKEEEQNLLAEQLSKMMEQQGEKYQMIKWDPDNPQSLSKFIEHYDRSVGYLVADCGSYHTNPEMPLISQLADITLWNVVISISKLKSIDFINYAIKEGLVKKGALVLTDALIDMNNYVNFGNFDYKTSKFSFAKFFSAVSSTETNTQEKGDKSSKNSSTLFLKKLKFGCFWKKRR